MTGPRRLAGGALGGPGFRPARAVRFGYRPFPG
jgi:hypothetical protein